MTGCRTRVLVVGNDWPYFISHRLPLVLALAHEGYDLHLALPRSHVRATMIPESLTLHYIHLARGGLNPFGELRTMGSLLRLYRRVRPDLVHHFTIKPVLYGGAAGRLCGVPSVINSMTGLGTLFASPDRAMRLLKRMVVPAMRYACSGNRTTTTFQNDQDRERFVRLGITSEASSVVIRGSGVDTGVFLPSPEPTGVPIVAFPSRLLWDKGLREFVEAARLLRANKVVARFVLVGGMDPNVTSVDERQLKDWQDEGVVELWGHATDMPDIFRRIHVACLPSYHEGLPRVLLEAASSGRPIVATDIPGCRDVVHDGENGFLVPVRDSIALAGAIRRLVDDRELRAGMGRRGREIVEQEFALPIVAEAFARLYRAVA